MSIFAFWVKHSSEGMARKVPVPVPRSTVSFSFCRFDVKLVSHSNCARERLLTRMYGGIWKLFSNGELQAVSSVEVKKSAMS